MGAIDFVVMGIGTSPREVYEELKEKAEVEYGCNPYNGTISTCTLGGCARVYTKATKTNEKKAIEYVKEQRGGRKWVADYVDVGVVGYRAYSIKIVPSKTTKRLTGVREYRARCKMKTGESRVKVYSSKGMAEVDAEHILLSSQGEFTDVTIVAVVEKDNGKEGIVPVSKVRVECKEYKTRPKEKAGRRVYEIHKYIFYGLAAI